MPKRRTGDVVNAVMTTTIYRVVPLEAICLRRDVRLTIPMRILTRARSRCYIRDRRAIRRNYALPGLGPSD